MIETKIYNALSTLCSGRVYHIKAEEETDKPYIVFNLISDVKGDTFSGISESNYSFQIDAYHNNIDELLILKADIIAKLGSLPIFSVSSRTSYEQNTELYRVMIEINIIQ